MSYSLDGLQPQPIWRLFEKLTTIPRPSRGEDALIAYIQQWGGDHGFEVASAGGRNLVVRVPASPGREAAPTLILQAHMDMVCERAPDSPYDPAEGRISLVRDGEWLTADGTTLGADDGIGMAAMMAIAEDPSVAHGPLELLMTAAEEVGLEGAKSVDGATLTGRRLLNLDSEEDGRITVGCAGSTDTFLRAEGACEIVGDDDRAFSVVATGGSGGHSGSNIAHGRANAIKVLARALGEAWEEVPFRLASLNGGKSRNAIPRDAAAVCVVPGARVDAFRSAIARAEGDIQDAFAKTDTGVRVEVTATDRPADAWSDSATRMLLDVVALVPSGPLAMSPDFPGLVETSTSLGVAATTGGQLELHSLTRTSNQSSLGGVIGSLAGLARLAGGTLQVDYGYAGWRPDLESPLLKTCVQVWESTFGDKPIVTAVHAGLETALVGEKIPGLDMASVGPQIEFPHSPDERVSIPTVQRFWTFLVGLVAEVSA